MMHVKSVTCTNSSLYSCTKSIVTVGLYVCIIVGSVALSGQIRRVEAGFTGDWRPWAGCFGYICFKFIHPKTIQEHAQ